MKMKPVCLFALIIIFPLINLFGQLEIDIYGKHLDYKGDIVRVTSEYFAPIYDSGTVNGNKIQPCDEVPRASIAHFNELGQLVKFEEFDAECGFDSDCLKFVTDYYYKNGLLSKTEWFTQGQENPRSIYFTFHSIGNSVFYEIEKMPN